MSEEWKWKFLCKLVSNLICWVSLKRIIIPIPVQNWQWWGQSHSELELVEQNTLLEKVKNKNWCSSFAETVNCAYLLQDQLQEHSAISERQQFKNWMVTALALSATSSQIGSNIEHNCTLWKRSVQLREQTGRPAHKQTAATKIHTRVFWPRPHAPKSIYYEK